MEFDFEKAFKWPVRFMRLNRSHPEVRRDKKWAIQFAIMHGVFTGMFLLLLYSTIFYELKNKNFFQVCANIIILVMYLIVSFDYFIMVWYQDVLKNLIDTMISDYEVAKMLPKEEQVLVWHFVRTGTWVGKLWLAVSVSTANLFPVQSIILMIYYAVIGDFQLVPAYPVHYPSPMEEVKNNLIVFVIMFLVMISYELNSMCIFGGLVPLGPIFLTHACGQLALVEYRINNVFTRDGYNIETATKTLTECIKHLQSIYSFVKNIERSFLLVYEISLKSIALGLPLASYQIIEAFHDGKLSLDFVTFVIGCILLSSNCCYYSDMLIRSGEKVREAVYSCGWERHWDPRIRSILLIILTRTTRPVAIRSMFHILSLDLLTDVYQQAYAIFNVLNASTA